MTDKTYNILFLCTGNSSRSIFAERLADRWGGGRLVGFSAGSRPESEVHRLTLEVLQQNNYMTEGLHTKSWDEFARPDAPEMDFIFIVCDDMSPDELPVFPGSPLVAQWPINDPAHDGEFGDGTPSAFRRAFAELEHRISIFANLPLHSLDRLKLQQHLDALGGNKATETTEA